MVSPCAAHCEKVIITLYWFYLISHTGSTLYWSLWVMLSPIDIVHLLTENWYKRIRPIRESLRIRGSPRAVTLPTTIPFSLQWSASLTTVSYFSMDGVAASETSHLPILPLASAPGHTVLKGLLPQGHQLCPAATSLCMCWALPLVRRQQQW